MVTQKCGLFNVELNSKNLLMIGLIIIIYVMLLCYLTKDTYEKLTNDIIKKDVIDTDILIKRQGQHNMNEIKYDMTRSETNYTPSVLKFKDYYDMIVSPL